MIPTTGGGQNSPPAFAPVEKFPIKIEFPNKTMATPKKTAAKKKAAAKKSKGPCWEGYKQVGTKKKAGKTVPNCVPKE